MQSGLSIFISQPKTQGAVAVGSSAVLGCSFPSELLSKLCFIPHPNAPPPAWVSHQINRPWRLGSDSVVNKKRECSSFGICDGPPASSTIRHYRGIEICVDRWRDSDPALKKILTRRQRSATCQKSYRNKQCSKSFHSSLTTFRAQARGADDVIRASGIDPAIPRCLQRFVRHHCNLCPG